MTQPVTSPAPDHSLAATVEMAIVRAVGMATLAPTPANLAREIRVVFWAAGRYGADWAFPRASAIRRATRHIHGLA